MYRENLNHNGPMRDNIETDNDLEERVKTIFNHNESLQEVL